MRMSKHNQPIFHLRMGRVGNRQRKRVGENCRRFIEANAVLRQIGSGLVFVPLKIERHRATLACDGRGDKRDLAHRARIPTRHPETQFSRFRSSDGFVAGAGKRVLGIYRRAGHRSRKRTHTDRSGTGATLIGSSPPAPATISWPRKLSGLAARCQSSEQRGHGFAISRRSEDQSGTAQGLKRGNRLLNLGVNVMMCPEFLRETFLFWPASNGCDLKAHAPRKLNSEVAKPTNALNSDELAGSGL